MTRYRLLAGALCALAVIGAAASAHAQDSTGESPLRESVAGRSVTVATKPLEPFVFTTGANPVEVRGFSIDVWSEVGSRLELTTEWVEYETVAAILDAVADGDADVAIAGISMTAEREVFIDFSHPYFDSGLQVVTSGKGERSTFATLFDLVTSRAVVVSVVALLGLVALIAHLVWWFERRHNPDFPQDYREGIGEALWWSSVSVVTGGEAVKSINRPLSRLLALFWMVVGLFLIALVTAKATSTLTVRELESSIGGLDDLPGETIGTVDGTVATTFLDQRNLDFQTFADVDAMLVAIADGDIGAGVFDAPVLAYRVSTDYEGVLQLAGPVVAPDPYGIAVATGSDLREPINEVLLEMARDGTLDRLHQIWFATDR